MKYFLFNNSKQSVYEFMKRFERPINLKMYEPKPVRIRSGLDPQTFFPSYNMIKQMTDNYIHN